MKIIRVRVYTPDNAMACRTDALMQPGLGCRGPIGPWGKGGKWEITPIGRGSKGPKTIDQKPSF